MSDRITFISSRVPPALYLQARAWLLAHDPDGAQILEWSTREIGPPADAAKMASEIIWIVLCAGRSAQAARTIEQKVWDAIDAGRPVVSAFGYRAKAAAIERAWRQRETDFLMLQGVLGDPAALIDWCGSLPFVGDETKFQLAKNFGVQVCKPDIWLSRLAGFPDKPRRPWRVRWEACMALCRELSEATGDSIATVDTILWLSCNKGVITVSPAAGPVTFIPRVITARPIMGSA